MPAQPAPGPRSTPKRPRRIIKSPHEMRSLKRGVQYPIAGPEEHTSSSLSTPGNLGPGASLPILYVTLPRPQKGTLILGDSHGAIFDFNDHKRVFSWPGLAWRSEPLYSTTERKMTLFYPQDKDSNDYISFQYRPSLHKALVETFAGRKVFSIENVPYPSQVNKVKRRFDRIKYQAQDSVIFRAELYSAKGRRPVALQFDEDFLRVFRLDTDIQGEIKPSGSYEWSQIDAAIGEGDFDDELAAIIRYKDSAVTFYLSKNHGREARMAFNRHNCEVGSISDKREVHDSVQNLPSSPHKPPSTPPQAQRAIPPERFYGSSSPVDMKEPVDGLSKASPKVNHGGSEADPIILDTPARKRPKREATKGVTYNETEDPLEPLEPTEEDINALRKAGYMPFKYEFQDKRKIEINLEDVARLGDHIYLNDVLVEFFMKQGLEALAMRDPAWADRILLVNTFFFTQATSRLNQLSGWVGKLPVFERHITILPIHQRHHWAVAVIIGMDEFPHVQPIIVILDSLLGSQVDRTQFRQVSTALGKIFKAQGKDAPNIRGYRTVAAAVPVQPNSTDCGVYMVHYLQQILKNPAEFVGYIEANSSRAPTAGNPGLKGSENPLKSQVLDIPEFWNPAELPTKRKALQNSLLELGQRLGTKSTLTPNLTDSEEDFDILITGMECVKRTTPPSKRALPMRSKPSLRGKSPDLDDITELPKAPDTGSLQTESPENL